MKLVCCRRNFKRWKRYGFLYDIESDRGWFVLDLMGSELKPFQFNELRNKPCLRWEFTATQIRDCDGHEDTKQNQWYIRPPWKMISYDTLEELEHANLGKIL